MQFDIRSTSGVVLLGGSILFLVAAFTPVSRVFAERSPEARIKVLQDHPTAWKVSQILFGLGASSTAIGLALAAVYLWTRGAGFWVFAGAALALLGALPWDWHVWLRAIKPAEFAQGLLPSWLFPTYTLITQAALVLFGIGLLQAGYPAWLGWASIIYPLLLFTAYLAFRDMPPFTYYLLTLLVGIVMIGR
jgi:hypothetical protein